MAPKRPASDPPPPSDAPLSDGEQAEEEANPSPASPPNKSPVIKPTNGPPNPRPNNDDDDEGGGADDGSADDGSGSGSGAEEGEKNPPSQLNTNKPAPRTSVPASTDDDGGEDEDSSDEGEPPPPQRPSRGADPSIKPINSRPMDGTPAPKKPTGASEPRSKKRRASSSRPSSEPKRQHFHRLWGLEDEMAILRGLANYRAKKGALPASTKDMERFHRLIRGSLSVEVAITQLSDKVRRLRKKFADASARGKRGADPAFGSAHERTMFELSKKVWGSRNAASENALAESDEEDRSGESEGKGDVGRSQNAKESNHASPIRVPKHGKILARGIAMANGNLVLDDKKVSYPYLSEAIDELAKEHPSGAVFKRAFAIIDDSKAKAMEEKIRKHRLVEIRHQLQRIDLMKATAKLVLDALEASEN